MTAFAKDLYLVGPRRYAFDFVQGLFLSPNCVGFRLDYSASAQQCFERFGVIEEQAVIDHLLIVGSQFCQCVVVGNKMKPTRDGRVIVDDFAMSTLLGEEDAFVIGNCTGKL